MTNEKNEVEILLAKAANTENATEAMQFSQAANNAANAMRTLQEARTMGLT